MRSREKKYLRISRHTQTQTGGVIKITVYHTLRISLHMKYNLLYKVLWTMLIYVHGLCAIITLMCMDLYAELA